MTRNGGPQFGACSIFSDHKQEFKCGIPEEIGRESALETQDLPGLIGAPRVPIIFEALSGLIRTREEHSMDQYRSRLKLSQNFERHWSILISGEIHMDQSLVHTFSWGNSYGPMVLQVFLEFPPTLVLVHGWLFPEDQSIARCSNGGTTDIAPKAPYVSPSMSLNVSFSAFPLAPHAR